MTRLLAAVLLMLAGSAHAQDGRYCSLLGSVYEVAAQARDLNLAPPDALAAVKPYLQYGPDLATQKRIINLVYFDLAFTYARGPKLRNQMVDLCINGPKQWKELK